MKERIWEKFLTKRDKAVFAAGGFGARAGFGKRPSLLVIDVNWAFCGERPEPILEAIKRWRTSCGEESWVALEYIRQLIETARAKGLPVISTTGERRSDNWDVGSWRWKSTRGDEASGTAHDEIDGNEIVTMIAPGPRDVAGHENRRPRHPHQRLRVEISKGHVRVGQSVLPEVRQRPPAAVIVVKNGYPDRFP